MKARVTQRDVALEAGVSHVTVSLALRGDSAISLQTTEKIKTIAARLGYSPDPMLSALSLYRKSQRPAAYHANIGWINNYAQPEQLYVVGDFARYHVGATQRAKELGYILEEIRLNDFSYDMNRVRRMLDARGIRGLILAPTTPTGELHLDISTYSAVRLGYSFRFPVVNTVTSAQFRAMLMTVQRLIERGYHRIGVVLADDFQERTSFHFLGGFLAGQSQLPAAVRIPPFFMNRHYHGIASVREWIVKNRMECVVGIASHTHYQMVIETGVKIPDEVGYADVALAEDEKFLSGMHQNARKIGSSAVDLLVSMMHRGEVGACEVPSHWLIEPSWLEGKTLKVPF